MRPAAFLLLLLPLSFADDLPYPAGRSQHTIEGLEVALHLPEDLSAESPASLVVLLHGLGDSGGNLIHVLRDWPEAGYAVLAPSCTDRAWSASDVQATIRIAQRLLKELPLDPDKVHCVGFSNGGWNLHPVAFADELKCRSAAWVAAGFRGGSVPKWAKKRLHALALAGSEDGNANAAAATVPALEDKTASAEVRFQPGLGHKWPRELVPYLKWWMGVAEGRFEPGDDRNFAWGDNVEEPLAALQGQKRGGVFVYYFHPDDAGKPEAKKLQNEVFRDPLVRHYGNQLAAVKLRYDADAAQHGVKQSPAVVVLDRNGKVKKVLQGKIKPRSLASALKSVAPNKKRPKR